MDDLISRQAVLEAIDAKAWEFCDYLISESRNEEQKPVSHFADNLRECISEDLPPVTPQPKTGYWIVHEIESTLKWLECSNCHCETSYKRMYNYCPNCGAKMVDPQERGDKCSKCEYYINPDYTRCKECGAERSDKE